MKIFLILAIVASVSALDSAKAIPLDHANPGTYSNVTASGWTLFKQCDSRWGSERLGTCSLTICQAGCAMSSVAMMLNTKGVDINPGKLNAWLTNNGGYANGCDIVWSKVDSFRKTNYVGQETAAHDVICKGESEGHGIILNVMGGKHWVLTTGCETGGYRVNDPGFSRSSYATVDVVRESVYH